MKIVAAVRCLNEINNIPRFMKGYDFCDHIVVSDGGSTDGSVELLSTYPKVRLFHFDQAEEVDGFRFNRDAPHMNFVLDMAKSFEPDWLIFDDMDCYPNQVLRENALVILAHCDRPQVNAFRLYLWGDDFYFPYMNRNFDPRYTSIWGWKPKEVDIHADPTVEHGTLVGLIPDPCQIFEPMCLLHRSWHPDTIEEKVRRYNTRGLPMNNPIKHPEDFGLPEELPSWAVE